MEKAVYQNSNGRQFLPENSAKDDLHGAVHRGDANGVRQLLKRGVVVDEFIDKDENTALIYACEYHQIEIMEILLQQGAGIDHKSKQGFAPLHYAVCCENKDAVAVLLKYKAQVNLPNSSRGNTPLHLATLKGYIEICEMLKNAGASAELKNKAGETALDCAKKHTNNLQKILRKGLPKNSSKKEEKKKEAKPKKKKPICQKSSKPVKPIQFKMSTKLFTISEISEEISDLVEKGKDKEKSSK